MKWPEALVLVALFVMLTFIGRDMVSCATNYPPAAPLETTANKTPSEPFTRHTLQVFYTDNSSCQVVIDYELILTIGEDPYYNHVSARGFSIPRTKG